MSNENIIRAWKDESYRKQMSEEAQAQLPKHPAGLVELDGSELDTAVGGIGRITRIPCSAVDACPSALGCTRACD